MSEQVSFDRLIEITDGEPILMKKLLGILLKNLTDFPQEIHKAFIENRDKEMRELAHKFKSSVAYLELHEFDADLLTLETSVESGLSRDEQVAIISAITMRSSEVIQSIAHKIESLS